MIDGLLADIVRFNPLCIIVSLKHVIREQYPHVYKKYFVFRGSNFLVDTPLMSCSDMIYNRSNPLLANIVHLEEYKNLNSQIREGLKHTISAGSGLRRLYIKYFIY